MATDPGGVLDRKAETNELIGYHSVISAAMTAERTALESALIPVTAYILVSAVEAFHRWPDIVRTIDMARPAEEIGAAARRPGCRVNAVHLWSASNIYLTGRKFLTAFNLAADEVEPTWAVLDFWQRAALAFHGGHRQAWDNGFVLQPYSDDVVAQLIDGTVEVGDEERTNIKRFNATVMAYLFLLYFDTRVGTGDSGPYPLSDGRTLLVRDFYQLGPSDFWWADVAGAVPYRNLTCALVLEGVDLKVNDWGTSITDPEDYLDKLVAFGLFTTDGGELAPVSLDDLNGIVTAVRAAQSKHYRNVAAMSRDEKIKCGAYVYFSFLRPFAELAGVADDIDWVVPRDVTGPLYDMLAAIGSQPAGAPGAAPPADPTTGGPYYAPIA